MAHLLRYLKERLILEKEHTNLRQTLHNSNIVECIDGKTIVKSPAYTKVYYYYIWNTDEQFQSSFSDIKSAYSEMIRKRDLGMILYEWYGVYGLRS